MKVGGVLANLPLLSERALHLLSLLHIQTPQNLWLLLVLSLWKLLTLLLEGLLHLLLHILLQGLLRSQGRLSWLIGNRRSLLLSHKLILPSTALIPGYQLANRLIIVV